MKKILFLAAATAVALSSCSKNEVTTSAGDNQAIGFGVYTGEATKGTVVNSYTLGDNNKAGFGVLGYYHESTTTTAAEWATTSTPNFMYNQQVKGDGNGSAEATTWTYDPIKYWPNNTVDRISFFAYAPYIEQTASDEAIELSANTAEGQPTIDFTIAALPENMVDFTVATPKYNQAKPDNASSFTTTIPLTFKHMLTRVNITAWTSVEGVGGFNGDSDTKVFVTDLQIVGTKNTTLEDKTNETDKVSLGFYSANKFTFATKDATGSGIVAEGAWSALADATKQTANYELANTNIMPLISNTFGGYTCASSIDITGTATGTSTSTALFESGEYLFLLPPAGNTGITAGTDDVLVYVAYEVVTDDDNLSAGYSVVKNQDIVALPAGTLKAGVAYNINLQLQLDKVDVSASVSDWATATEDDIHTPDVNE